MNTSKTWSRTPAPVRNLHDILNSSRVPSFFRMVLDSFKHVRFLWNFKLKLNIMKGTPLYNGIILSTAIAQICRLTKLIVSHIFAANKTDSELPFLCSLGHLKHKSTYMGRSISGQRKVSCINFRTLLLVETYKNKLSWLEIPPILSMKNY